EAAHRFAGALPPASVLVVDRGRVVVQWGDPSKKIRISSMRKSILSALYGIYLPDSGLHLDTTLESLGIDDDPPLTIRERQATLRMLLESRSGVYHGYVGEMPGMRADWPSRESHVPGDLWFNNDWDFNALGAIFEQQFTVAIAVAFHDRIAVPLQM